MDAPALDEPVPAPPAGPPPSRRLLWRVAWATPLVLALPWLAGARALPVERFFASLAGMVFVLTALTATTTDLLWRRIYNWTTYTAVVWMWGLQLVALLAPAGAAVPEPSPARWGQDAPPVSVQELLGVRDVGEQAVGMFLAFAVMFLLRSALGGGGGDLKLATAFGTMLGPYRVGEALVYAYIIAGVGTACYLLWTVGPREVVAALGRTLGLWSGGDRADPVWKERLPMGPFLSLGAFLAASDRLGRLF